MIKGRNVYFIDFQGGRIGPIQYDLASLLIDPYVQLPHAIQTQLIDYSIKMMSAVIDLRPAKFLSCYHYCRLTRNLQILGAFSYLSKVKGKPLPDWAAEIECTSWAQIFLKFVVSHPAVTCAIPGMTKARHVADNIAAARGPFPDQDQRVAMEQFFEEL